MPLTPGTRLGPYEITGSLGAGGMGEVYKARDTRLDRSVAIKVLPPEVSADPDRRARFEREAKTIAGLNHPHICTLHDVGATCRRQQAARRRADRGPSRLDYLVMELLAGETLADRLEKGPLPLEQALGVADRDRRRARGGAPAGHHPSRPEAGERDAHEERAPSCSTSASRS